MFCCIACICFLGVINYHLNTDQHHLEYNQTLFSTWSAILPAQGVNCNAEWFRANNPTELHLHRFSSAHFGLAWHGLVQMGVYHVGSSYVNLR